MWINQRLIKKKPHLLYSIDEVLNYLNEAYFTTIFLDNVLPLLIPLN